MEITRDNLVKQIAEWQGNKQHLLAELNLLQGRIQAFEMLLKQEDDEEGIADVGINETIDSNL